MYAGPKETAAINRLIPTRLRQKKWPESPRNAKPKGRQKGKKRRKKTAMTVLGFNKTRTMLAVEERWGGRRIMRTAQDDPKADSFPAQGTPEHGYTKQDLLDIIARSRR